MEGSKKSFRIFVWSEKAHVALRVLIGLKSFEARKSVVESGIERMDF